jgi:adenylylsulfate kinase-like enzyme
MDQPLAVSRMLLTGMPGKRWRPARRSGEVVDDVGGDRARPDDILGVVIVITGPIASGKSTIASELARSLELANIRAEVIDLDQVHDGLPPDGSTSETSTWTRARREAATAANALLAEGVAVVIADGSFNLPIDRETFVRDLRRSSRVLFVTLRVSFEEALRRAQADPTRGRSRDRQFLASHFEARRAELATVPSTDIQIDTERTTTAEAAARIARLLAKRAP